MSKLIKSIGRGIKKVFKAVKKVVKKVTSSKIFKAVAVAAAIYFTAGAVAGSLGAGAGAGAGAASSGAAATSAAAASSQAAMLGSGLGFPSATWGATTAATGGAAAAAGGTSALAASGNAISSLLSAGASKAAGLAKWSVATPGNAMIASTGLNIAGQVIGAKSAADAEMDRYNAEKTEFDTNTAFRLNIADRLKGGTGGGVGPQLSYTPTTTQGQTGGQAAMQKPSSNTGYYDPTTDSYRNV